MTNDRADTAAEFAQRLHNLATPFLFRSRHLDVDEAIRLACDLIVANADSPATVSVAALRFGTPGRDSQPLIREMLREHGVPTPGEEASDDERFGFMLKWFAAGYLTFGDVWGPLLRWLRGWNEQTAVQRAIVQLSSELDQQTVPAARAEVVKAIRAVAACPLDATNAELPLRIKIEAAFRLTGRGTVLAGTIEQGTIRAGDEIELVQLTDDGDIETVPLVCKSVEGIFQPDRDPALSPLIGIPVSGIEPESVKAGSWLQHRTQPV